MDEITDKNLLIIFAYAPAGFGHLRVSDALNDGLPTKARHPLLLGSHDEAISYFHRLFSNSTIGRALFEWSQRGWAEDIFTLIYRSLLRMRSTQVYDQLLTILDQRIDKPHKVLIIATHFALAHQIGQIKQKIRKERNLEVTLVVQVTDDSPQHLWYIPEADLTFVPSNFTKKALQQYGKESRQKEIEIIVNAYPVSPALGQSHKSDFCEDKFKQIDPSRHEIIHIMLPISGAAVGMSYFLQLIDELNQKSSRYVFHVVAKSSQQTQQFLNDMMQRSYVDLHVGSDNRDVVNIYEDVYKKHMISIEITKPSEQAFKALLSPTQLGGSILLFTKPIGRQEYDNIAFLRRHNLTPLHGETVYMWDRFTRGLSLDTEEGILLNRKAGQWRGLKIPHEAKAAAQFIHHSLKQGLFMRMMNCHLPSQRNYMDPEVNPYGVTTFWKILNDYIGKDHES